MAGKLLGRMGVAGFALALLLAGGVVFGFSALRELDRTSATLWAVVHHNADAVISAAQLHVGTDRAALLSRDYLLYGDDEARRAALAYDREFDAEWQELAGLAQDPGSRRLLSQILALKEELRDIDAERFAARTAAERAQVRTRTEKLREELQRQIGPLHTQLDDAEEAVFEQAKSAAWAAEHRGRLQLGIVALSGLALTVVVTLFLMRVLGQLAGSRKELEALNARLLGRNRELDAFGGRVAHDLRNLLGPVALAASMLERGSSRPEIVSRVAERLQSIVRRSNTLIEDLLSFSRAGQPADGHARASLAQAVHDAVEDLEPNARAVDARVEVDVPEAMVACAPGLLHTLLVNLVGNAIKFLDGCPTREVRITSRVAGEMAEIAVADTGPGIPEEARHQLFTPFYRVPGTRAAGTGIGLATVSRIVEAHQGTVEVESALDHGSVFRVRLPLLETPAAV
jgi:signal transduction histidine kinase